MTEREELEQLFLEKITQDCDGEVHAFSPEYRRNMQRTLNSLRKNAKPLRQQRRLAGVGIRRVRIRNHHEH